MNIKARTVLANSLITFLANQCLVMEQKTSSSFLITRLPFEGYNGLTVEVLIEKTSVGFCLHDGGRIVHYLRDHGIRLDAKSKPPIIARRLYKRLSERFDFALDEDGRRFSRNIPELDGCAVFKFAMAMGQMTFAVAPSLLRRKRATS